MKNKIICSFWQKYGCKWWGHKVITTYMHNYPKMPKHIFAKNGVVAFSIGLRDKRKKYLNLCSRCGSWSIDYRKGKITL